MEQDGIPDDGESQSRPAGITRPSLIHPIKTFEDTYQVLFLHTGTSIVELKKVGIFVFIITAYHDINLFPSIGNSIFNQVPKDRIEKCTATINPYSII